MMRAKERMVSSEMQTADDGGVQGVCGDGRMKAIGMPILAGDGVLDEMRWAVEGCDSFSSGSLWWDGWEGCVRFDYEKLQQTDFCCWGRCLWGGSMKKSEGGGSRRAEVCTHSGIQPQPQASLTRPLSCTPLLRTDELSSHSRSCDEG